MFKDSSWYLCEEIDGEKMCKIKLKHRKYDETYEIKTDKAFDNLFDDNGWDMFSTAGSYIDKMTSYINEMPSGFGEKRIQIKVRSTNDYWFWQGDDVKIVHRKRIGSELEIESKIILRAGEEERSTYFDARPDDRFSIENAGSDGVYIKEFLFDDKEIQLNGKSSFWIDGDEKQCDGSYMIAVSWFTVVNGEVTASPCIDS